MKKTAPSAPGPRARGAEDPRADLRRRLERRAPGQWELYVKRAESWERDSSPTRARVAHRAEEGWAARWWDRGGPRFAASSSPAGLAASIDAAARFAVADEPPPAWPTRAFAAPAGSTADAAWPPEAPDLFAELGRLVSAGSKGECAAEGLALRQGTVEETIENGAGLDVVMRRSACDGVATVIARRGARAREVRLPFRGAAPPELEPMARRLCDAATLPLADPEAPPARGQWLLDPAVGAALAAALAPLFLSERPPRWIVRGALASAEVSMADDATRDAPFDGEGVATRRVLLVDEGRLAGGLHDLRSARRAGQASTGHGVRPSYRTPPAAGPRRIFFQSQSPKPAAQLLAAVTRGLYASALTAPARVDPEGDRYELEFTGIAVIAGRARGPVAGVRASGRLSELLQRVAAVSDDTQFFPLPFLAGAPTILIERATFE